MAPRLTNWHRADVVAEVHKRGSNLAELARGNGKGESTLRVALSYPSTPSNKIIAAFLGRELHEIWPAWFDKHGRRRRSTKAIRANSRASSQKVTEKLTLAGDRAA